jgi:hypothetical protein
LYYVGFNRADIAILIVAVTAGRVLGNDLLDGQSVAAVKEELAQLRLRVELSEGTLSSDNGADHIKTLEKRSLRLEKEEHDLKVKLTKEASTDTQREAAARIAVSQAQELIISLTKEQQTTQAARESAYQDLGNVKKQAVMARLKELHENITRTRTEAEAGVSNQGDS